MDNKSDETSEAEVRSRILAQFTAKWGPEEAERRVNLLGEVIPRIPEYAQLNNQRVDIKVHPEHMEFYISQLQPKIRAVIEHTSPAVIDKILDSHNTDERVAKVIRIVNMLDEKAAAAKKVAEDGLGESQQG